MGFLEQFSAGGASEEKDAKEILKEKIKEIEKLPPIEVSSREEAFSHLKNHLKEELERKFGKEGTDPLVYHVLKHSEGVAQNTADILSAIKQVDPSLVKDEDFWWSDVRAYGHDIEQHASTSLAQRQQKVPITARRPSYIPQEIREKGTITLPSGEFGMRLRQAGLNEEWSAEYVRNQLKRYHIGGERAFSDKEISSEIDESIEATTPNFDFFSQVPESVLKKYDLDPTEYGAGLKIYQPKLKPEASVVSFALATGDLRGEFRAQKGGAAFIQSGNREFEELHDVEIKRILQEIARNESSGSIGIQNIGKERVKLQAKIDRLSSAMIGWMRTQVVFPLHQEHLFEESLKENNLLKNRPDLQEAIRKQYDFRPAVLAAKARYEAVKEKFGRRLLLPAPHFEIEDFEELLSRLVNVEKIKNKIRLEGGAD